MINESTTRLLSAIVLLGKADYHFVDRTSKFDEYYVSLERECLLYSKGNNTVKIETDDENIYIELNGKSVDNMWELRQFVGIFRDEQEREEYFNTIHPYPVNP